MARIEAINAREILDSRGEPTLEVDVVLDDGTLGRASVPSGASKGSREAFELRDGDPRRFGGRGVLRAVEAVHRLIAPALTGFFVTGQSELDEVLCRVDLSPKKSAIGGNVTLAVSLAFARARAINNEIPLYRSLCGGNASVLPVPLFNLLSGGRHATNRLDVEDFLLIPAGAESFAHALQMGAETHHALGELLRTRGHSTALGDEGGFTPQLRGTAEAIELLLEAVTKVGLRPGKDVGLGLDVAASSLRDPSGRYVFRDPDRHLQSSEELIQTYESWVRQYPLWSIEDGLSEDDWAGWRELTRRLGDEVQVVADDLLTTNPALTRAAVEEGVANCVLIKLNQVGTLTEAVQAVELARHGGYGAIVSHRSGETTDDFIADLAVALEVGQLKAGAPARGERVAKYNQLLRIEADLGALARYAGLRWRRSLLPERQATLFSQPSLTTTTTAYDSLPFASLRIGHLLPRPGS